MSYIRPEVVLSPKKRVGGILEVIHDPGEGGMSVARILWDGEPAIATRWNGNAEQPLGNPMSRRQATWFVVDDYAAAKVEEAARTAAEQSPNSLIAKYREMANDVQHEKEADEWSEGLIGDASSEG
ncbi:MAG: hypothetical protein WBV55_09425 [Candidatus Sulfotelmatobacter sp.]